MCCQRGGARLWCAPMKSGSLLCLAVLSLVPGLLAGCASSDAGTAATDAATQKTGHWVTLPPETGTYIPRRVWVDDSGQTSELPSANNVQTGGAGALQRMQKGTGSSRPPGS